jgi:catechol 2,3-dioxygenase-like lactoylglutathione lyase family enzyme
MITKMSHTCLFVLDQDEALDFYKNKLGLEVRTDSTMEGGFRWLTVGPKDQPDLEIILMPVVTNAMYDDETKKILKDALKKGAMGAGVFLTNDCRASYEELKAKGVHFMSEPTEKFYGIETVFKDPSGNWFSLTQTNKK